MTSSNRITVKTIGTVKQVTILTLTKNQFILCNRTENMTNFVIHGFSPVGRRRPRTSIRRPGRSSRPPVHFGPEGTRLDPIFSVHFIESKMDFNGPIWTRLYDLIGPIWTCRDDHLSSILYVYQNGLHAAKRKLGRAKLQRRNSRTSTIWKLQICSLAVGVLVSFLSLIHI